MQITEKHRPRQLSEVAGQSETVESLQRLISTGSLSGSAVYLIGASGTGKTTIARALCNDLAIDDRDLFAIVGQDCTADFVRKLQYDFQLSAWGNSGWKVCIVDEAHAISRAGVQCLLKYLEELPRNRLVIFTSTEGNETDLYGNFTGPLFSRCKVFNLSLDIDEAARHVAKVAQSENLDGQEHAAYVRLMAECKGNIRAALQAVECGRMKQCLTSTTTVQSPSSTPVGSAIRGITPTKSASSVTSPSSVLASERERLQRLAVELETGRRLSAFPDSEHKSKQLAKHYERLRKFEK